MTSVLTLIKLRFCEMRKQNKLLTPLKQQQHTSYIFPQFKELVIRKYACIHRTYNIQSWEHIHIDYTLEKEAMNTETEISLIQFYT